MTPAAAREMLDRFLAKRGEDVTLRRSIGTGAAPTNHDAVVRAQVRALKEDEIVGKAAQDDRMLIMSPTQIAAQSWPGGTFSEPRRGDKAIVSGVPCNAEFVKPIRMAGQLVRIEIRIRG
jgi:hypothetical protein